MRRALAATMLVGFLGPLCAAASAQSGILDQALGGGNLIASTGAQVRFAGQLTVSFHGDQGTGCAARGLCAYGGTVSWRPRRAGELVLETFRVHGHRTDKALLLLGSGDSTAPVGAVTSDRVRSPAGCSDAVGARLTLTLPVRRRKIVLDLAGAAPSLLTTRCAGPLAADIAATLPRLALSFAALRRGRRTIDLAGGGSFAANGLAGTVSSTLKLSLGPGQHRSAGPPPSPSDQRYVEVTYRVSVSGSLAAEVRGDADPFVCGPLGSCGAVGADHALPHASGRADLVVGARDSSQTYADLLTILGLAHARRPGAVDVLGEASWNAGGIVQSDLSQGSSRCADSMALAAAGVLLGARNGRLLAAYPVTGDPLFSLLLGGGAGPSSLRTRCPGPLGSGQSLAVGQLPLRALRASRTILRLDTGSAFAEDGYTVHTSPHLQLTFTRLRILRGLLPQGSG